jgi:hypothetical protein
MPTIEELPNTEASLSPNLSAALLKEVFEQSSWRLYVSSDNFQTKGLVNRYLASHAQVPGGVSSTMHGFVPIETFRFVASSKLYEGFLFSNGAVVHIQDAHGKMVLGLFIDEQTADMWGYPPSFLSYEERTRPQQRNGTTSDQTKVDPTEP